MSTETILTTQEILHEHHGTDADLDFARAIEQAVLHSEQVQAWKRDAERYRWLRAGGNDDIGVVRGFDGIDYGSTSVAYTYEEGLSGEQLDEAIDHARRVEGEA